MCHGGLETCTTAEADARERRDVKTAAPYSVQLLRERAADFVTASGDKIDARVWIKTMQCEYPG